MRFHIIKRPARSDTHTLCGLELGDVYRSLEDHVATEVAVENRRTWYPGDRVCLACVRKARPSTPKQLRACRSVNLGEWVVLCGCGGVRPYGKSCGR